MNKPYKPLPTTIPFDDDVLLCPVCGGNNLHHQRVDVYDRSEDASECQVTRVNGRETTVSTEPNIVSGNPSSRRDGLVVHFTCEACHSEEGVQPPNLTLTISQHKRVDNYGVESVEMTKKFGKEKDVKAAVKKLLETHKWFWFMPPANGYGRTGISDIIAVRHGVFMAIETKFGSNGISPMQNGFLNSIAANEGFAFVVNEGTLDKLAAWLRLFDSAIACQMAGKRVPDADGAVMLDAIKAMTEAYA